MFPTIICFASSVTRSHRDITIFQHEKIQIKIAGVLYYLLIYILHPHTGYFYPWGHAYMHQVKLLKMYRFPIKYILRDTLPQRACWWTTAFCQIATSQIIFSESMCCETVADYIRDIMLGWLFTACIEYFSHINAWMFKGHDCIYT